MSGWLTDASRAYDFIIEPAVVENKAYTKHLPTIGFAFRVVGEEEPITVALVGTPEVLKLFKKQVDAAVEKALKLARMRTAEAARERNNEKQGKSTVEGENQNQRRATREGSEASSGDETEAQ